ncbi:MAG: hypothetical protein Phog2KO_39650 [Phototrophicaceae bacterium]
MNKYYGLRLIRTFFISASAVISIFIIGTVGALGGLSILNGATFDGIQAILLVIAGGLVALLSYAFGQLIELQLKNYEVSWKLYEQIQEANKLNNKTVQLLNKQLKIMRLQYNLDEEIDIKHIERQLDDRRNKLS